MDTIVQIISINNLSEAEKQMLKIGADKRGIEIMAPKAVFRAVKLKDVPVISANIIKQEMLSCGGEAATSYGVINHSTKKSDVILFGVLSQYARLIEKLKMQDFGLPNLAEQIQKALANFERNYFNTKKIKFGEKTFVMGILNVTPDSFSDGGKFVDLENAKDHCLSMIADGVDIIDIGGESTRPGAETISEKEEASRVIPLLKKILSQKKKIGKVLISIDTRKSSVAKMALKLGADIINDVSGLTYSHDMAEVVAKYNVPVIIMHSKGDPKTMQINPAYNDLISEIMSFFEERASFACKNGVKEENIIIDPGIGFGKTVEHNFEILRRIDEFRKLGFPICLGTSRKSFLGKFLNLEVPNERDFATIATIPIAVAKKVDIIRVHNVKPSVQAAKVSDKIFREEI